MFEEVADSVKIKGRRGRPRTRPKKLSGDKGYDSKKIRKWLKDKGIRPIIPKRKYNSKKNDEMKEIDKELYRNRNVVERCIGWLKQCRRVAMRFEKLAVNFLAMVKLAIISRYLRKYLRDTT